MFTSEEIKKHIEESGKQIARSYEWNNSSATKDFIQESQSSSLIAIAKSLAIIADNLSQENPLICPSCQLQMTNALELREHNKVIHGVQGIDDTQIIEQNLFYTLPKSERSTESFDEEDQILTNHPSVELSEKQKDDIWENVSQKVGDNAFACRFCRKTYMSKETARICALSHPKGVA